MLVRSLASKFPGDLKQPELQCSMQIIVPSDLDLRLSKEDSNVPCTTGVGVARI